MAEARLLTHNPKSYSHERVKHIEIEAILDEAGGRRYSPCAGRNTSFLRIEMCAYSSLHTQA